MLTRVIKKFFKSKSVDEPLAERIKDAKTIGDFADIVAESGYELTNDDFNSGLAEILDEELSEDDLEQASGGRTPPCGNNCMPGFI